MRLGLLLPMTAAGKYIRGAATLAIAEINADLSIMQGRRLEYLYADSGCSPIAGLRAIQELLLDAKPIHGVIGAGCSSACEAVAFVTAERGLPQVCPLPSLACWISRIMRAFGNRSHMAALLMFCHPGRSMSLWIDKVMHLRPKLFRQIRLAPVCVCARARARARV